MSSREQFLRWYMFQLLTYDCDPAIYVMKYLIARYELNTEQKYWLCWLYANTYQLPTAWVMFNEFPDYENVCASRMDKWCRENTARLPYQKDQKWLRGKLGETFLSYQAAMTGSAQHVTFYGFVEHGNGAENFECLWNWSNKKLHRFGRYTSWFYLQALSEICNLHLTPTSLYLSDPSSKMPREGLTLALLDELQDMTPHRTDKANCVELDRMARELVWEARERIVPAEYEHAVDWPLPVKADLFSLETSLCSYSKLRRGGGKGRYLGYYLDRFALDIENTASHKWTGINWDALWEARSEILLPELNHTGIRLEEMETFPLLGEFSTDSALLARLLESTQPGSSLL